MEYKRTMTATVYVVNDGRVLLHKHKKYKTWFALGGHVEAGELPSEAAVREAREEAGIDIRLVSTECAPHIELARVERLAAPFCLLREGIGSEEEFLDFIYVGETDELSTHPDSGESAELRWFTREELEQAEIKTHVKNTALAVLDFWLGIRSGAARNDI